MLRKNRQTQLALAQSAKRMSELSDKENATKLAAYRAETKQEQAEWALLEKPQPSGTTETVEEGEGIPSGFIALGILSVCGLLLWQIERFLNPPAQSWQKTWSSCWGYC